MADTTGPIVLAGGLTVISDYMQDQGWQWRTVLATGLAAGVLALIEQANKGLAVALAWLALITSLLTPRKNGSQPPVQTFLREWNKTTPRTARQMAT
jgi:hypothetical protein